jgi:hypothetical protein
MVEYSLGIVQTGTILGVAVVQRNYRQKTVRLSKTFTLHSHNRDAVSAQMEIASIVQNLVSREKIRKPRVSIGLEQQDIMWDTLEMPPVSQDDLRQIVQFEIDSHVPIDPDQCEFDIQVLESIEGLNNRVTLFTTHQDVIEKIRETAIQASVSLDAVAPVDTALVRFMAAHTADRTGKNLLALCATETGIHIIVSRNGRFVTSRSVSSVNPWNNPEERDNRETQEQTAVVDGGDLVKNIKIALLSANESLDNVSEILCVGDMPETYLELLSEAMQDIPVHRFRVEDVIAAGSHYAETAAVALAVELFENTNPVNLLPARFRPVRRDMGRIMIGVSAGLLLASMVMVGANNYWSTDLRLLETEARLASMENQVNLITEINMQHSAAQESRNYFLNKNMNYPSHLDILLEATRLLPTQDTATLKKVWLEQLDIDKREITIRGDSNSPEAIITVLEDSPYFERVRFDGTVTGTRFTIKATISQITDDPETGDEFFMTPENGDEMPEQAEDESSQPAQTSREKQDDGADATPVPDYAEDDHMEMETYESETIRGPAFPRSDPGQEYSGDEEQGYDDFETLSPDEQAERDAELEQEDMDAVKNRLLDFIRERSAEQGAGMDEQYMYEDPDPEESSANFIEFLKTIAESENEGESQWQE